MSSYLASLVRVFVPAARKSIQGKVVLVTGSGGGIGREIAKELSKHGASIALWDVNMEGVEETAQMVTEAGCKALPDKVDVTNTAEIAEAADRIRKNLGEVDILINNAGIINSALFLELTEKAIRKLYEVNTLGQYWTVREFLPSMIERKSGHIVNMCSTSSFLGCQYFTDYAASKAAIRNFTKALRRELSFQEMDFVNITSSKMLTPNSVAKAMVEGMLRNQRDVFIPAAFKWLPTLTGILPASIVDYFVVTQTPDMKQEMKKEA